MRLIEALSLAVAIVLLLLEMSKHPLSEPIAETGRKYHYSAFLLFIFWGALVFVAGFRNGFVDTVTYRQLYERVGTDFAFAFTDEMELETGFKLLMIFLNRITPDSQILIFLTSFVILSIEIKQICKYSSDIPFSLLLYFLLSFMGTMNGIRQCLAAAILFLAFDWILKRKTAPYILLVLLVSTIHTSALICIPLYFIMSGKRLNWGIWLFFAAILAVFAFPTAADNILLHILEDSTYEEYVTNQEKMGAMRLFVAAVPTLLALLYSRFTRINHTQISRVTGVLINMQMLSFGFTLMGLKMLYYARLSMYVGYANILLLPITIKGCFRGRDATWVKIISIILYVLFFAYQIFSYDKYGYMRSFYLVF